MHDNLDSGFSEQHSFSRFTNARVPILITNPHLADNPIVYVNQEFTRVTGYARSAVIGRNCRFLQGEQTNINDVDSIRLGLENEESITQDILNYRANGEPFMNRLIVSPILDTEGQTQFYMSIQKELKPKDVSTSIALADAQMVEIQNRVQSDLSMIIGMIRKQSTVTSVPEDFAALSRRVEILQLLYEEMSLADAQHEGDRIQLGSLLSRITSAIAHSEGRAGIRLNLQIEPLQVPVETATRVGLVLSELVSNAFQHAFDRLDQGLVEVRMSTLSGGGLRLIVSDDGVGLPQDMEWPDATFVGGRIVNGLIEGLEGTLQLNRGAAGSFIAIDVPAHENMHV